MTETAISNITSLDDEVEIVCRTVGKPQSGMEHKVVDKNRRVVPIGQLARPPKGRVSGIGGRTIPAVWTN